MEFNGINKVNIVKNPYLKQKTKKQSAKNEQKNQNKNLKNTPSNPSYWQSYVGIKNNAINLNNNNNISRPNALGLNKETIASVNSNSQIPIGDGSTISVNDYINNLLSQKVGFKTKEEYQTFVLDKFTSHLNEMKSTYQAQEKDNGFISKLYDGAKELLGLGTSSKDAENSINKYEQMVQGLTDAINGKSDMTFEQAWEHYTGTPFSTEKIDNYIETSNMYSAVMVGCQYDENYLKNFEKTTGKSVNDVMKNYAQCQLDTFGEISEVKNVVDSYAKDQQTYSDKLSSIISTAGLACTVVGAVTTFFCPPVGIALMNASRGIALTGMFIDNAIDLVDNATDSDGLTKDEIKNLALETGVEGISYIAGRKIGKFTNGLNSVVSSKVAQAGASKVTSYIAGQAAETVVDTALSLGADYAIAQGQSLITTGEFMDSKDYWSLDRFLGEGKNQLIGILTGLSSVKVSAYQQGVIKTAQEMVLSGDTDGAKTYLKKSGMKMNDTDFEGFVKNVQEVETQVKVQTSEDAASNPVETEAQKPIDSDTTKPVEAEVEKAVDTTVDTETQKSAETQKPVEEADGTKIATESSTKPKVVDEKTVAAIKKYRQKASHITEETLTVNGKPVQFEILHGSKDGGSNSGYYVVNKETGELFYAKMPNGGKQWLAEIAATKLYEAAGIDVPQIEIFSSANGTKGVLSKYIPELESLKSPNALANDGFGMDVLLENWDAIGLSYDNTLITADGTKVIKLDNGGSFDYKAQGQNKSFTAIPMELVTMLNPKTNPQATSIYGKMSQTDLIASLEKAVSVDDARIDAVLKQYNCEEYSATLKKRKKFLQGVIAEMKHTPQLQSESTFTYMQKITNSCLNDAIDQATTKAELDDIYTALSNITDMSVKQALQNKISSKLPNVSTVTPKYYTSKDIDTALKKAGFSKNPDGSYRLNISESELDKLTKSFGTYGSSAKYLYEKEINLADIDNIRLMLNQASKVMDISAIDMTRVVLLYNNIKSGNTKMFEAENIGKMTPAKWAMVLNITKGKQITESQLIALLNYKSNSSQINGGLSDLANHLSISPSTQKQIDDLQAYINTQVIPEDIVLKRVEGYYCSGKTDNPYGCLFKVDFNGRPLSEVLDEAVAGGTSSIQAIEDAINYGCKSKLVARNERFTSACVLPEAIKSGTGLGKVVWNLTLKKGSKGAFLEGTNFGGCLSSECEILLQKDSQFEITGIEWDSKIKKWVIDANVTN